MKKYLCGVDFLFVGLLVLIAAGCGTLRAHNRPQKTANVELTRQTKVYQLAKSRVSWDDALLPAYPQGHPEITILRIVKR